MRERKAEDMITPWTRNMTWVWRLRIATWLLGKAMKLEPGQTITQAYKTPWLCYPAIKNPERTRQDWEFATIFRDIFTKDIPHVTEVGRLNMAIGQVRAIREDAE